MKYQGITKPLQSAEHPPRVAEPATGKTEKRQNATKEWRFIGSKIGWVLTKKTKKISNPAFITLPSASVLLFAFFFYWCCAISRIMPPTGWYSPVEILLYLSVYRHKADDNETRGFVCTR